MASRVHRFAGFDARFAVTRRTISRAKAFDRSAKEDLEQYRRWLDNYAAAEARDRRKHERRLKRLHLLRRRWIQLRRIGRWSKRRALEAQSFLRATSLTIWKMSIVVGRHALRLSLATAAWTASTARSFARWVRKWFGIGALWLKPRAQRRGLLISTQSARTLAFTRAQALSAALKLRQAARTGFAWSERQARSFARSTIRLSGAGMAWARVNGKAGGVAALAATSRASSWVKASAHDFAAFAEARFQALDESAGRTLKRWMNEPSGAAPEREAPVRKPSTALVPVAASSTALIVFVPPPAREARASPSVVAAPPSIAPVSKPRQRKNAKHASDSTPRPKQHKSRKRGKASSRSRRKTPPHMGPTRLH